jgi:hypothetical protein
MGFAFISSLGRRAAVAMVVALFAVLLSVGSLAGARATGKASIAEGGKGRATTSLAADSTGGGGSSTSPNVRKPR